MGFVAIVILLYFAYAVIWTSSSTSWALDPLNAVDEPRDDEGSGGIDVASSTSTKSSADRNSWAAAVSSTFAIVGSVDFHLWRATPSNSGDEHRWFSASPHGVAITAGG